MGILTVDGLIRKLEEAKKMNSGEMEIEIHCGDGFFKAVSEEDAYVQIGQNASGRQFIPNTFVLDSCADE